MFLLVVSKIEREGVLQHPGAAMNLLLADSAHTPANTKALVKASSLAL